ncbi:hypothetical protein EON71_00080 [bacterium]|nr:MAG: hypothetical protein EON71_00080 [bacterium]
MLLTKQLVRKGYLIHSGWVVITFLALLIVLTIPDLDNKERKFLYPYPLLTNLIPMCLSFLTVSVLENTVGGIYLGVISSVNIISVIINISLFTAFIVQYKSCHTNDDQQMDYSENDKSNILCELPGNTKFCIGFMVIVIAFIITNGVLIFIIEMNKKFNKDSQIKAAESKIKGHRNVKDHNPSNVKALHFKLLLNTILDVSLLGTSVLSILSASIVDYSKISLMFIVEIITYGPAIAAAYGTNYLKKIWFVVFVSTIASLISLSMLILNIVYFYKLCYGQSHKEVFFGDDKCVVGYRASICYIVLHSIFLFINTTRGSMNALHGIYQSNHQEKSMNKSAMKYDHLDDFGM